MGNVLGMDIGDVGISLSGGGGGGGMAINWVLILIILLVVITVVIVGYVVYMNRLFNRKIIVFENISGQGYQPILRDKARLIRIGDGGEEILFLKKKKVYRTAYGRKMGKNTYWFAVGQDGYWYNIVLGDLDAKMGMLDIEPIDRDMRYMHVAVRKNIQERYRKLDFMQKYGTIAMNAVFLLIMIIGIWILLQKMGSISEASAAAVDAAKQVLDATNGALGNLDNIVGGSGYTQV